MKYLILKIVSKLKKESTSTKICIKQRDIFLVVETTPSLKEIFPGEIGGGVVPK